MTKKIFSKTSLFIISCCLLFIFNCEPEIKETPTPKFAPTDITLSKDNIDETLPVGTVIGDLTTVDEDSKTHTYSVDSVDFEIVGNQLKSKIVFDFEKKSSYEITIKTKDSDDNIFVKKFTITINDRDETPPTDINLSGNSIDEGLAIGSVVATLTTTDTSPNDNFTYQLVAGAGDDDNASFTIDGDKLKSAKVFDYEVKTSYKIRIQTTDFTGNKLAKEFSININNSLTETISYAFNTGTKYREASVNDGSIDDSQFITVTTVGLVFKDSLTVTTDYTVANVPSGLTMAVTKLTDNTAKITFTGKATSHASGNSVNNVTITFKDSAFVGSPDISGIPARTKSNIGIDFITAPPMFSYIYNQSEEKLFVEKISDDGSINSIFFIDCYVENGTFEGANNFIYIEGTHYTVHKLPAGLTFSVKKEKSKITRILIKGNAIGHAAANDVDDVSITLLPAILNNDPDLSAVSSKTESGIKIRFDIKFLRMNYDLRVISESLSTPSKINEDYREGYANGITFNSAINNGDNLTEGTHYQFINKPAGLNVRLQKYESAFGMTPSGNFDPHTSAQNTEFTIRFLSAAFEGNPDINTIYNSDLKMRIEFND